jgi:hypothetical protein
MIIDSLDKQEKFNLNLPISIDWSILNFDTPNLPDTFKVTFIDAGLGFGQWSAIALRIKNANE